MIKITKIPNGCNCYIAENDEVAILIDPGLNQKKEQIIKICKEKVIKLMVLTHGHVDHIQCAADVAKELQIPIMMHQNDLELIDYNLKQPLHGRKVMGKIVAFFSILSAKSSVIKPFKVTEIITCDRTVNEYGIPFEIIQLPGHTKGSVGIKIENHLFVGDALMNMFGADVSLLYENKDVLFESATKISSVGDVTIHFGHGNEVSNRQW